MTIYLRHNTASQEIPLGYFLDSADGNTEETALTIANTDIKLWKAGATSLVNKNSGGATHMANGIYSAVLDATDTNTQGPLVIFVHVSGALTVRLECVVLNPNIYDSFFGTDFLDVSLVQWLGTAPLALSSQRVQTSVGAMSANVINASALAADAVDEIWDEVFEGSLTARQALRLFLAVLAGKSTGGGGTTPKFRDQADSKNRVDATVDANGNRTAVTLDAT